MEKPPAYFQFVNISLKISDHAKNYTFPTAGVHFVIEDFPFDVIFVVPFNQTAVISIKWPLSIASYNLSLTAVPNSIAYREKNWSDNTYILRNESAGIKPTFLIGKIQDLVRNNETISFTAYYLICVTMPFRIGLLNEWDQVIIPANTIGSIRDDYIIGFFR